MFVRLTLSLNWVPIMKRVCCSVSMNLLVLCLVPFAWSQDSASPAATAPTAATNELKDPAAPYRAAALKKWETEIGKLEAQDQTEHYPDDAILLLGSSSIRLWKEAAEDLAPYSVIPRGYGGAKFSDLAVFVERLAKPHRFRGVVLFVGNDVTGGEEDKTPEEVSRLVGFIIDALHQHQPEAEVFLIEITPTPKRFAVWDKIREVNVRLRELCLTRPHATFIPTAEYYLTSDNQPRPELFREDRLHQNREGYALWARLIKRQLDDQLSN